MWERPMMQVIEEPRCSESAQFRFRCFKQAVRCVDDFTKKPFIFIPVAFVFGKVAAPVSKIKQPPRAGFVPERVGQALKDDIAAVRAVTAVS